MCGMNRDKKSILKALIEYKSNSFKIYSYCILKRGHRGSKIIKRIKNI